MSCGELKPNSDWAKLPLFDRKGWRTMAFGEFAECVNERVEPADAADVIYVGLDDLDSGCLHVRRWGKGSDVIGTKLRFRKGDIIFGRRRAYQRKLAVAEFDGICSAHAMVVRAKPKLVLREFLPFLMMSNRFMKRAVEISVGSLSPTINWTTLKHEPFALPPLDQQRRIAEILWAVDDAIQSSKLLAEDIQKAADATAHSTVFPFGYSPNNRSLDSRYDSGFRTLSADQLYEVFSGNGEPQMDEAGDSLFFKVNDFNLNSDETALTSGGTRFLTKDNSSIRLMPPGTVVFPKRGASIFLNKVGIVRQAVALDPNVMGLIPKSDNVTSDYLYWLIKLTKIGRIADTTSLPQINHKHLTPLLFPVPSLKKQSNFIERIGQIRRSGVTVERQIDALKNLSTQLTNTVVTP